MRLFVRFVFGMLAALLLAFAAVVIYCIERWAPEKQKADQLPPGLRPIQRPVVKLVWDRGW